MSLHIKQFCTLTTQDINLIQSEDSQNSQNLQQEVIENLNEMPERLETQRW